MIRSGTCARSTAGRAAIGLTYEIEKPAKYPPDDHRVGRGVVEVTTKITRYDRFHLEKKPISRLIMGVRQSIQTLPHAAVMFDDFFGAAAGFFDTAQSMAAEIAGEVTGAMGESAAFAENRVIISG